MQPQGNEDSSIQRQQTPPNQSSLSAQQPHETLKLQSTPRRSGTPRSTTNVTAHRSEVLDQMKDEMVRCDAWNDGFDHYLPATGIACQDIDAAVEALKKKKHLRAVDSGQNLQFTAFETTPSLSKKNEKDCYEPLIEICEVLGNLKLRNGRKVSCNLIQKPNSLSSAETYGANFIVDAYLELKESTMPRLDTSSVRKHIADMAVPSEYKKLERDSLDNRKKILGATTFCMNDDPRRMHIYGITIEDCNMTVWYFSRSHSARSPTFDFTKDPRKYIEVMLTFLFATEEELGYDQTIWRRLVSNSPGKQTLCYVYKVKERYFKTQEAIFEHRSLCATGRATRVWKVVEVKSSKNLQPRGSSIFVLKDVWLDTESKTEGENLEAIFRELQGLADLLDKGDGELDIFKAFDEDEKELVEALKECLKSGSWERYFLTKICDWQGKKSKEMAPTAQPDSTLFDPPTPAPPASANPYSDQSRSATVRVTDLVPVARKRPLRHYCSKQQYRVVFKEVCEALHHVRRLDHVVTALRDSVFALQLMFLAGWVHRDISSGNIYACSYQESGTDGAKVRGILADLEYAKPFDPEGAKASSDPKTGTAFFMAVEIQKQALFYNPKANSARPSVHQNVEPQPFTGVIHNFAHDVESMFWLFLWIFLARFPPERSEEEKKEFAGDLATIFQDTSQCPQERDNLFADGTSLHLFLKRWLNPELKPISIPLANLCNALLVGYYRRAHNFGDMTSYTWLYPFLLEVLKPLERSSLLTPSPRVDKLAHVIIKRKHNSNHAGGRRQQPAPQDRQSGK